MIVLEKNEKDYYEFKPHNYREAFSFYVSVKCYSLKNIFSQKSIFIRKGEIREIIEYPGMSQVEVSCRTHCSDGIIYYSRVGVQEALGDDYETFVTKGEVKSYYLKKIFGKRGECRPYVYLAALLFLSYLFCKIYSAWIFPHCRNFTERASTLCQNLLVQHAVQTTSNLLLIFFWGASFLLLGFYFTFCLRKNEKHTFCVAKTKWIGVFFILIGLFFVLGIHRDYLSDGKFRTTYTFFEIARDPAAAYYLDNNHLENSKLGPEVKK